MARSNGNLPNNPLRRAQAHHQNNQRAKRRADRPATVFAASAVAGIVVLVLYVEWFWLSRFASATGGRWPTVVQIAVLIGAASFEYARGQAAAAERQNYGGWTASLALTAAQRHSAFWRDLLDRCLIGLAWAAAPIALAAYLLSPSAAQWALWSAAMIGGSGSAWILALAERQRGQASGRASLASRIHAAYRRSQRPGNTRTLRTRPRITWRPPMPRRLALGYWGIRAAGTERRVFLVALAAIIIAIIAHRALWPVWVIGLVVGLLGHGLFSGLAGTEPLVSTTLRCAPISYRRAAAALWALPLSLSVGWMIVVLAFALWSSPSHMAAAGFAALLLALVLDALLVLALLAQPAKPKNARQLHFVRLLALGIALQSGGPLIIALVLGVVLLQAILAARSVRVAPPC